MKYKVTFYQCAVIYEPEQFRTKRKAEREAAAFLNGFRGMPGYQRQGSIRREGSAAYVHPCFGTEAAVSVHTI